IGKDISFADLRAEHDTLLIATGVYKSRDLKIPGVASTGVEEALDYLIASNRQGLGENVPAFENGTLSAKDKRVVVIGGGDTAMDCVRTAIRQDAKSVTCLYRRDRTNMPGSAREVQNAEEEGAIFEWLASPEAILATKAGTTKAVRASRMKLGPPDASGRQSPLKTGETFEIKADLVVRALGFDPEDLPSLWGEPKLTVNRWGAVRIDFKTMMTGLPGVFAAGDIVRGGSLVVWAIKDGRDASEAMHQHMKAMAQTARTAAE
ncbi:MAG: FAD-dependent oxidoreductase, partial [Pseudomonadota bacterium]